MSWIRPLKMNYNISLSIIEGKPTNCLTALVQKIAIYSIIPFAFIVFFETAVKSAFVNLANFGISFINCAHDVYLQEKK